MHNLTIAEANQKLKNKEITSVQLTQAVLDRIKKVEPQIDAYLTLIEQEALAQAEIIDTNGDFSHPLTGIPVGIKDVYCTKGVKTTAASKILENYIPPYDATVIKKLKDAGAIIIGKVNTDEFTMGSSTENSAFKTTKNPWDLNRVPGGSSGGSAAAVAADECIFSLGTDTGGSIRQPASFCSCTGLKNTYGRVSRYGVMSYASSFDSIGPLTKTVEDAAIVLEAIAGEDPKDATTLNAVVPKYSEEIKQDIKGMRIGIPKEFFVEGLDPQVEKITRDAIAKFEELGAVIEEVSLPLTKYAIATYYLLVKSEASTNLARYDGIKYGHTTEDSEAKELADIYSYSRTEGFGDEVKRAIMMGTYTLSAGYYDAYYLKAAKVRRLIKEEYDRVFEKVDILLAPVSPVLPFKIGANIDDPLAMYLVDILTVPVNLAGICGLSIPAGFAEEEGKRLPVGVQLLGPQLGESKILKAGYHFQQNTNYHKEKPEL